MIAGMKLKGLFFDDKKVIAAVDRATRKVLSKFGAFVRTAARSSIRTRKKPSQPGSPPSSHTGLLKRFIYFFYEPNTKSVIIGPARFASASSDAPHVLEYGGRPRGSYKPATFAVGDYGPVSVGGSYGRLTWTAKGKLRVVRTLIKSDRQAQRATRLHREYQIGGRPGGINIAARPFMGPAFEREKPKLPAMWADSVT